jgi:hypothetical protein
MLDARHGEISLRKIHDGWFTGPAGEPIVSTAATRAAVYFVRDPRDVAVSFAHHAGRDVEWAVELMCDPQGTLARSARRLNNQLRQRLGSWSDHVRSWVDDAPFEVHVVRYEDAHADPVATFGAALRFCGFETDDDRVSQAVDHARFGRLQGQEAERGFRERPTRAERFFRRGEAGTWTEELPADLARRLEHTHADVMARMGYD